MTEIAEAVPESPVATETGRQRWTAALRRAYKRREDIVVVASAVVFLVGINWRISTPDVEELRKEISWLQDQNSTMHQHIAQLLDRNDQIQQQLHATRAENDRLKDTLAKERVDVALNEAHLARNRPQLFDAATQRSRDPVSTQKILGPPAGSNRDR